MLENLLLPEIQTLIAERDLKGLRQVLSEWDSAELAHLIEHLDSPDDLIAFRILPRELAARTFEYFSTDYQQELIEALASREHRLAELLNDLSPDDRTTLLEEVPGPMAQRLIALLSPQERRIALMLLGYPEDSIGRLMTPDYVALRPDWSVEQALRHIRRFGKDSETLNILYVVNDRWQLLDAVHIREILLGDPEILISQLASHRHVFSLKALDDQEVAVEAFLETDHVALPVTDTQGILLGIVTVDDVLDIAEEEATEDIQLIGGSEALDEPYLSNSIWDLVRKRGRWLVILFFGEMLTAAAMGTFQSQIEQAVVLALFVPLIISSGGNSGSQAATLIIRALALNELTLRDWWHVMRREILSGLALGGILGVIGFLRVLSGEALFHQYGAHAVLVGVVVGLSLLGVVLLGTLVGSMLPLLLKRLGTDPATSSAPFVATLVDVAGLFLYFTLALWILDGALL